MTSNNSYSLARFLVVPITTAIIAVGTSSLWSEIEAQQIAKIRVISASVDNQNFYSDTYGPAMAVDSNIESYWSTRSGAILDVALDFSFEKTSTISSLRIYAPDKGNSYTQPKTMNLIFLDESDVEISRRRIRLTGSYAEWQSYEFDPVNGASSVRITIDELTRDIASYLTVNEIEFFGQ